MRKTKIICTIGPASDDEAVLTAMIKAGMNVARLNFSHGSYEEHDARIRRIKKVRDEQNAPLPIMLDTKGPEYRIGTFENGSVMVPDGAPFTFTTEELVGDETRVSVTYKNLIHDLSVGDRILVNNGLVEFRVEELAGSEARCTTVIGGELSNHKSMNFPNHLMTNDYLSENDKNDLLFGIEHDIDFVAASFVSRKKDLEDLRDFLDTHGGAGIEIIAKIENRSGVDHIEEICELADGIMVARGDLGVEIPYDEVPSIQKHLIRKCRLLGRRVITATEMLESMIHEPRPTRAEASDVANAVYDGTSCVMLSGETAAGKFPVESVAAMDEICAFTESQIDYKRKFYRNAYKIRNNLDAVSHSTCAMAIDIGAKCIVVNSLSGRTARMVSRFRAPIDIIGMTTSEHIWRRLEMSWGVTPVLAEEFDSTEVMFYHSQRTVAHLRNLQVGDNIVMTGGSVAGKVGGSNTIKVGIISESDVRG